MTTPPIVSITDELIAELESELAKNDGTGICMSDSEMRALLAERAELKRDAERMEFIVNEEITISKMYGTGMPMVYQCQWHDCRQVDWYTSEREAIDAAMQAAQ